MTRWHEFRGHHPTTWVTGRAETLARNERESARAEEAGRWSAAVARLDACLVADPGRADLRLRRGGARACLGDEEAAEAAFRGALSALPVDTPTAVNGGWWIAGPYAEELRTPFAPEQDAGTDRSSGTSHRLGQGWQPLPAGLDGHIDLGASFGRAEHITAYALARVYVPSPRRAALHVGSDEAVRVWCNGRLVPDADRTCSAAPDQDLVAVPLEAGRNTLLAKVVNGVGGHELYLRLSEKPADLLRADIDAEDWTKAAGDLAALVSLSPDRAELRYQHALALLANGDLAGYRHAAAAALEWFGAATGRDATMEIARASALGPDAVANRGRVVHLAETSIAESRAQPWRHYVPGLALHRGPTRGGNRTPP